MGLGLRQPWLFPYKSNGLSKSLNFPWKLLEAGLKVPISQSHCEGQ